MNILLVEDDAKRIAYFKKHLSAHHLVICRHVKAAKNTLKKQDFNLIFLDHDLRGKPDDPESDQCGTEVARFIVARDIDCDAIILHSENDIGREAMEDVLLARCEPIPYHRLKKIGLRVIIERFS